MTRSNARRAIASPSAAKRIDDGEYVDPDRIVERDSEGAPAAPASGEGAPLADFTWKNVGPGSIVSAPLGALIVDARNARHGKEAADIDALAATIEQAGVLQPLLGYVTSTGAIAITDGARRFAALQRLTAPDDVRFVPVRLHDESEAEFIALTANTQRVQLNAAQEARAFAKLLAHAQSASERPDAVRDIARAFAVDTRHVEQRLTLAKLHPPILDALDEGKIDLDTAKAYARADVPLQAKVWDTQGPAALALTVKTALAKSTLDARDPLARFVGEAAYIAAGGQIVRDFFGGEDDGAWADRKLAAKLADQKLADEKARFEAEGWATVVVAQRAPSRWRYDFVKGKKRTATDAEQQDLADIARRQKEIRAEEDAIYAAQDDESRKLTDAEQTRIDALEAENDALSDRCDAIEEALFEFDAKAKAKSGVVLFINENGAVGVRRGATRKTEGAGARGGASATRNQNAKPATRPEPEIDGATREAITLQAGVIIGRAIAAQPQAGLAVVASDLARQTFADGYADELVVEARRVEIVAPFKMESDEAWRVQRGAWVTQLKPLLKKPGALERELLTWTPDALAKLIAFCVAAKFDASLYSHMEATPERIAPYAAFGESLGIDPGMHWTPSLAVMKGFNEKALRAACAEIGVDAPAKATQAQLAAMVADRAAAVKWTPPIVRQIVGATWTKIAVAKAPKKRGRPTNEERAARVAAAIKDMVKRGVAKDAAAPKTTVKQAAKKPAPKKAPKKVARKIAKAKAA